MTGRNFTGKLGNNSVENKIAFIAEKLLSYEKIFAGSLNNLKRTLWTVLILHFAVYYGWKLLVTFFG